MTSVSAELLPLQNVLQGIAEEGADVVVPDILAALDLLLFPRRLVATLRR